MATVGRLQTLYILLAIMLSVTRAVVQRQQRPQQSADQLQYPEGYFPFEQSPARTPPKVRRPPYAQTKDHCPGVEAATVSEGVQSLDNLCGDLNKGYIPMNPFGHSTNGQSYPFELVRNKTLDFFSSTLPILKQDKNLPKVAKYQDFELIDRNDVGLASMKLKRSGMDSVSEARRNNHFRRRRAMCEKNYGILCTIYNLFNGRLASASEAEAERRRDPDLLPLNSVSHSNNKQQSTLSDDPLTPCPSAAEYVTPVYAKNYQGVWRYVVQIPYEGYFTQTVEVTKCLRNVCHFVDGSCLASPRWLSLLVAELFYPHARFPATRPGASVRSLSSPEETPVQGETMSSDRQNEDDDRRTKRDNGDASNTTYCDGIDDIGCYQVRLYYDWFLVAGSCKCWKQDFFTKYGGKR